MSTTQSTDLHFVGAAHNAATLARSERRLTSLLSAVAGMVDVIGFLSLGIFTAHVTGNIVIVGALLVRHNKVNWAQILAIPFFILAIIATWLIAKVSSRRNGSLMRLLLVVQFIWILGLFVFSAITKPSADPHGPVATIAAMIAVSAMGCQFTLLRLALPVAPSTAVMTGNLTNFVLALIDSSSPEHPLMENDAKRLGSALYLFFGFFAGCIVASVAVVYLGDWAWSLPATLAGIVAVNRWDISK